MTLLGKAACAPGRSRRKSEDYRLGTSPRERSGKGRKPADGTRPTTRRPGRPHRRSAIRAGDPALGHGGVGDRLRVSSSRIDSALWRRRRLSTGPAVAGTASTWASPSAAAPPRAGWARIDVATEALTVEICRPPKPGWLSSECAAHQPPPRVQGQENYPPLSDQRSTKPWRRPSLSEMPGR